MTRSIVVLVVLALSCTRLAAQEDSNSNYVIGPGDVLAVHVFYEPQLSGSFRVETGSGGCGMPGARRGLEPAPGRSRSSWSESTMTAAPTASASTRPHHGTRAGGMSGSSAAKARRHARSHG